MPRFLAVYTMRPEDLGAFRARPKAEQEAIDEVGLKAWAHWDKRNAAGGDADLRPATARVAANWRRVYAMPVASVYPAYIAKAEKKGRIQSEVDQIFRWLTGHSQASLEDELAKGKAMDKILRR